MRFQLNRFYEDDLQTLGTLMCGDRLLFTIERPWKQNQAFISRILPGDFDMLIKHEEDFPVDFKTGIRLDRIGGDTERTLINIEVANWASEVEGCIGVGTGLQTSENAKYMVTHSWTGLEILSETVRDVTGNQGLPCILTIEDRF